MYKCPECGDKDHIDIVVPVMVRLIQPDDDPEGFQTDADMSEDGSHEWDDSSLAYCHACGYSDRLSCFEHHEDEEIRLQAREDANLQEGVGSSQRDLRKGVVQHDPRVP